MKRIALLGASGSIGKSSIDVINNNPRKFKLVAVSVYNNIEFLEELLLKINTIELICLKNQEDVNKFSDKYPHIHFVCGNEGLIYIAKSKYDLLINALVGFVGLLPTYEAIKSKHHIALANKESLVAGGEIIMKLAKHNKVNIYPIDSEHSAIFQCLEKGNVIHKVIITASGGPFYKCDKEHLKNVSVNEALNHPNWKMGRKITIDSATMFNKAFEVIEAHHLFNLSSNQIEVLIHPQSMIHSMVEFNDGSIKAQLAVPDMKLPIAYALTFPKRLNKVSNYISWNQISQFDFHTADFNRFNALKLAYDVLMKKGTTGTVLNAANEIAVNKFLEGKIAFYQIDEVVNKTFVAHKNKKRNLTIEDILIADKWARDYARRLCDDLI